MHFFTKFADNFKVWLFIVQCRPAMIMDVPSPFSEGAVEEAYTCLKKVKTRTDVETSKNQEHLTEMQKSNHDVSLDIFLKL